MKETLGALLLATLAATGLAQEILPPPLPGANDALALLGSETPTEDLVDLTIAVEAGGRNAGDPVHGTVIARIEQGWHINSHQPKDEFSIASELRLQSPGIEIDSVEYPPHIERTFAFAGGELLAVYEGDVAIPFDGSRTAGGAVALTATLYYQACNDRVCLPPREEVASVEIGADGIAVVVSQLDEPADPVGTAGDFTRLEDAPPPGSTPLFSSDIGATLESRGLLLTLIVVFVLGLALNLTPCVYPLIPLTVAYFSSQTGTSRARRVGLASSYVLGLAAMYSALGVFSALSGRLFGAWLQSPAVLVFFAALMLLLAASMFGAYEIRVPHFISDRAGTRSGYAGAATMGLLAGIVAAPCVGPFIISLIAMVSQRGSVGFGFLLFFILALGLGLPYLILGIFTTAAGSIPRSGPWMVQIKQALGFVLVAMAFYFLRPVIQEDVYRWGAGLSLLFGALFLLLRRAGAAKSAFTVRAICGILLLAASLFFLWPRTIGPEVEWTSYELELLAAASSAGQPVMIDFYADWCLPCKELDAKTFSDPAVVEESQRFVRLKADLTSTRDSRVKRLSDQYSILGVPTIVFIGTDGNEQRDARLTGFEPPDEFVARMRKIR